MESLPDRLPDVPEKGPLGGTAMLGIEKLFQQAQTQLSLSFFGAACVIAPHNARLADALLGEAGLRVASAAANWRLGALRKNSER
jgi:hypothetical protein